MIQTRVYDRDITSFHNHLNTIIPHIQFTIETPAINNIEQSIAFLDTEIRTNIAGRIKVQVFRQTTHTDKYLAFDSHNPNNDKRAVVKTLMQRAYNIPSEKTLMQRAYNIPSENILKKQEIARVKQALILNGYKSAFVDTVYKRKNTASKDMDTVYNKLRGFTAVCKRNIREGEIHPKSIWNSHSFQTRTHFRECIPKTKG